MLQIFTWTPPGDGDFWKDIAKRAEQFAQAGFTALWMPPPTKGQAGVDDVGYGVYDLYDLGEFDQKGSIRTRYGTASEFVACVAACKKAGLLTLADIVLNHRMGADATETFMAVEVATDDREKELSEPFELEAWTRFDFPGRGDVHSDFKWRWHHFNATDHTANDAGGDHSKIFRIANKNFAHDVGHENGNYDYLMGCNHHLEQPDVREQMFDWADWFLETTGVDGFRIDAAKHMPVHFLQDLLGHLRDQRGEEIYSVAEYAIPDAARLQEFVAATGGSIHAFDFALKHNFIRAAKEGRDFDLRTLFDDTLVASQPQSAVTFVENHDHDPAQHEGRLDHWIDDWFKPHAYAAILLRRDGFPCVFIGDYDGRTQDSSDGGAGLALTHHGELINHLLRARATHGHGDQHDHFDEANRIAWTRTGDEQHPGGMIVVLNTADEATHRIPTHRPSTTYVNLFDTSKTITTDDNGHAEVPVDGGAIAVWITD